MSRAVYLSMNEGEVTSKCASLGVGISTLEVLPNAGTRLVCMSVHGAETMRRKLKSRLIDDATERFKVRPRTPLW